MVGFRGSCRKCLIRLIRLAYFFSALFAETQYAYNAVILEVKKEIPA
jgi:hypothetical protein